MKTLPLFDQPTKPSTFSICLFFVMTIVQMLCSSASAQSYVSVKGAQQLIPIAVPQLCLQSGESTANKDIPTAIGRDLDLSGYFEVLDPGQYIESPSKCGADSIVYSDWTVLRALGVVRGVVSGGAGRIKVQMFLHDVAKQQVVLGKEYEGSSADISRIAHKFANEIMKFYTGEYGPFGTEIAFSTKIGRFKELAVMDMDGSNIRQLTNDHSLSFSASWSPNGQKLVFTSYRSRVPDLFVMDLNSRRLSQVTGNAKMELGPKFTQDGSGIITSVSDGLNSNIVILNTNGQVTRNITESNGIIDVSPHWSPDYSKIIFCSNRAGGPQIYTMNTDGSDIKRVSFSSSNYCTSPAWSPKGDKIAYVCRADAGFQLFVSNPDGSDALQLTGYGDNEDPDWSPDGRYLAFGSTLGKGRTFSLALIRVDGANMKQLTVGRGGDSQPSWGPRID